MAKFLALDIGEKRIGIARSSGSFAFPLDTLDVDENIQTGLHRVIQEENPDKIIIGLPRNMDGTLGFQAKRVKKFVKKNLESYSTEIEYEDETVTSIEAKKLMKLEGKDPRKDKEQIDAYAAKIILESYMNR